MPKSDSAPMETPRPIGIQHRVLSFSPPAALSQLTSMLWGMKVECEVANGVVRNDDVETPRCLYLVEDID